MKRDRDQHLGVATGGTLKDMKATISANKIGKLFELLQAPYSDPIGSIVRETATNAWDAHREIGQNRPIEIVFDMDAHEGYFVEFIDQGIGMDEERISTVFVNYLESTKEDTDEQAGHFGIGSKAPLSYADEYFLTTIADKTKYEYIIRKDDDGIPMISLLGFEDCDKHTGSTIKIYLKSKYDTERFLIACQKQLHYFEHVVVINKTDIREESYQFNNKFSILKGVHFITKLNHAGNTADTHKLVTAYWDTASSGILTCSIGQVAYPISLATIRDTTLSENEAKEFEEKVLLLTQIGVGLRFDISDPIDVIMTREAIRYNNVINKCIREKVNLAYTEVLAKNLNNRTDTKFSDYIQITSDSPINILSRMTSAQSREIRFMQYMVPVKTTVAFKNSSYFWHFNDKMYQSYQLKGIVIDVCKKLIRYKQFNENGNHVPKSSEFFSYLANNIQVAIKDNQINGRVIRSWYDNGVSYNVLNTNKYSNVNGKWVNLYETKRLSSVYNSSQIKKGALIWNFVKDIGELWPKEEKDMHTLSRICGKVLMELLPFDRIEDDLLNNSFYTLRDTLHNEAQIYGATQLELNAAVTIDGVIDVNHHVPRDFGIMSSGAYGKSKMYLNKILEAAKVTTVIAYKQVDYIDPHSIKQIFSLFDKDERAGKTKPILIRVDQKNLNILTKNGIPNYSTHISIGLRLPPVNRIKKNIYAWLIKTYLPNVGVMFGEGLKLSRISKSIRGYEDAEVELTKFFNNEPKSYLNRAIGNEQVKIYKLYVKKHPELLQVVGNFRDLDLRLRRVRIAYEKGSFDTVSMFTSDLGMKWYNRNIALDFIHSSFVQANVRGKREANYIRSQINKGYPDYHTKYVSKSSD